VGQALATKAIAECVRSGGVWEAESNMELFDLVFRVGLGCVVHGGNAAFQTTKKGAKF
jgi:hypothetical protein